MLNSRQAKILSVVVKEYTQTATPVSSGILVKKYQLEYSPATVRNEMMALEEAGLLLKPHISSGRIPSDKGYRYFVDNLMDQRELSREYQKKLEMELLRERTKNARMARTVAKLLSGMSHCVAVSGIVEKDEYYDFGMHALLDDPEYAKLDEISRLSCALDLIDENVDVILEKIKDDKTGIFIGQENPIKEIRNYSMVVSPYKFESGERGLVAIIGPKRMKYNRNKSLIDFIRKILSGKSVMILVLITNGSIIFLY